MRRPLGFVFALVFIGMGSFSSVAQQADITLEDIWKSNTFGAKDVSGLRSMNDGVHYTRTVSDGGVQSIVKYEYATGQAVDTLYKGTEAKTAEGKTITFADYEFNTDETKILLATERESIYRHSSRSHYYAYDLGGHRVTPITDFERGKQQLAAFSPTANRVAFVRDNDLYIADRVRAHRQ